MKEYGPPDNPWPELPPAATLYAVHWPDGGPPTPQLRLLMGVTCSSNSGNTTNGTLSVGESGTESGSVSVLFATFTTDAQGLISMFVDSWSGSTSMFNQNPTKYISVAPGATWEAALTVSIYLDPAPPGLDTQHGLATATVVSIDPETGLINGDLLSATAECESGTSGSGSNFASGVAPA